MLFLLIAKGFILFADHPTLFMMMLFQRFEAVNLLLAAILLYSSFKVKIHNFQYLDSSYLLDQHLLCSYLYGTNDFQSFKIVGIATEAHKCFYTFDIPSCNFRLKAWKTNIANLSHTGI